MELKGKIAIVTGAGGSIGQALAIEFAKAGAKVVCCGRDESKLKKTLELIEQKGGMGIAIPTDVTKWKPVQRLVDRALKEFGQIDFLFNNAGSFKYVGPVWAAEPDVWWYDVRINLFGTMMCCRAVLPHMIERNAGIIINMDGGGGSNAPNVGGSAYGCSKAAILRFSEGLARELEIVRSSVLVFCMMPGFVRSNMTEYLISTPEREKWQPHVRTLIGSEAELPPDACAKATMKLLSIASPELNGRIFYVDMDYEKIDRNKKRIQQENLHVMHLLTLDGKLGTWPLVDTKQGIS